MCVYKNMSPQEDHNKRLRDFFAHEYDKLANFVRRRIGHSVRDFTAEDIVQEVALNLTNYADFDRPIENLAAYVYRSIRNKIVDLQRRPDKEINYDSLTDEQDANIFLKTYALDSIAQEDASEQSIDIQALYLAIDQLKADEKALIIETVFNGLTFRELSEEWNVPIGTLLARKHRTLSKLQKLLIVNS